MTASVFAAAIGQPEVAIPALALGLFKLNSARKWAEKSGNLLGEALAGSSCDESAKNLYGVLPFGEKFDDVNEPQPWEADLFKDLSVLDILGEIGGATP